MTKQQLGSLEPGTIVRVVVEGGYLGCNKIACDIFMLDASGMREANQLVTVATARHDDIVTIIRLLDYVSHAKTAETANYAILHESGVMGACVLNTNDQVIL